MTIALIAIGILLVLWLISTQRKLVVLDENINNAMSQIGVQTASRWDALTALLKLTKGYAQHEYETISNTVKMRTAINGNSTVKDAEAQEQLYSQAKSQIFAVAESYPELKASETYITTMNSVNQYEDTVRTARMVYNDSVTKLNRAVRMFPVSLIAGLFGFSQRDYLQVDQAKSDMPDMQ